MASKRVRSGAAINRALPSPTTGITSDQCLFLAGRPCDLVADLSFFADACVAVERFVSPVYADEAHIGVPPSRNELGALLTMLNNETRRSRGNPSERSS
ncbi:hypothetical protein [Hydrogenophaga sp.]|uniref:hypothetical protein n=1 Tax=Hydrogenophaga sp. TaxID=1904254 RepID=UPI0027245749|nr:hypothetical protein [Hydrogenophaga sp.]MDO9435225.1 hypothetical protein [Hydrogenophaga sp.]